MYSPTPPLYQIDGMQKSWQSTISKIPRKSRRQLYVFPPLTITRSLLFSSFRTGAQPQYLVYNRGYAKKTTPMNSKKRNAWYVVGIWPQRPALRLFVATVFVTNVGKVFAPFYHYSIWNPPPSGYFDVKIKEGGSLDIVCMGHKCGKVVGPSIIKKIVNEDTYKKFTDFFLMSYGSLLPILLPLCHSSNIFLVVEHPNVKYCPAPGCKNAIISESANELVVPCEFSPPHLYNPLLISKNISGDCGYRFCFVCNEESHAPSDCAQVWLWLKKSIVQSNLFHPQRWNCGLKSVKTIARHTSM